MLTINYYDDYVFDWNVHPDAVNPANVNAYGQTLASNNYSLATGSKVKVLETNDWITTYTVYDQDGAPIWVASSNSFLNTFGVVKTHLDFSDTVLESEATHTKEGQQSITTKDYFTYDHQLRSLTQKQQINDGELQLIAHNSYDELGRLVGKKVGGQTALAEDFSQPGPNGLQNIDLAYTVRGWLKEINDIDTAPGAPNFKLFNFKINYDTTEATGASVPLYNGNISETLWRTAGPENEAKGYRYTYDAMNRFKEARFVRRPGANFVNTLWYRERIGGYDKNGNILDLWRSAGTNGNGQYIITDNLGYSYTGNQLSGVRERLGTNNTTTVERRRDEGFYDGNISGTDYSYDKNGNQTSDANKGITAITYNHLNLPTLVTVNGTSAEGVEQLAKIHASPTTF